MGKRTLVTVCVLAAAAVSVAVGQQQRRNLGPEQAAGMPPRVVAVDPPLNSTDVDPDLMEIRITFDRPMTTEQSWSWMRLQHHGVYPGLRQAAPRFDETGRTCILGAALEPGLIYAIGANSPTHKGFRDAGGLPALNFGWAFATGGFEAEDLPPRVVSTVPAAGATDVEATVTEMSVTFDRPMRPDTWSWVLQPDRGEFPGVRGATPWFNEDRTTCTLPVALAPGTVYALSINSHDLTGFKSLTSVPALPHGWAFKTGPAPEAPPD